MMTLLALLFVFFLDLAVALQSCSHVLFPRQTFVSLSATPIPREPQTYHVVDDVVCREIGIDLPVVDRVTVLEATAESQESLVDMALALDEDELHGNDQKLSAGDPYGAVLWPAASAVAKYLLTEISDKEGMLTAKVR